MVEAVAAVYDRRNEKQLEGKVRRYRPPTPAVRANLVSGQPTPSKSVGRQMDADEAMERRHADSSQPPIGTCCRRRSKRGTGGSLAAGRGRGGRPDGGQHGHSTAPA